MSKGIRKIATCIIVIAIIAFMVATAYMKLTSDEEPKEGYIEVNDVPGITFEVNKTMSDTATAVLEISKNINFIDYQSYSYKNGEDTYLLFSINKYIIIAKRGTEFMLSEGPEGLSNHSMNGIWFTPVGDIVHENGMYKQQVEAQVVITNALYNDFYGTLTTVEADGEEWSLFAGTVDKENEEYTDMIKYVVSSFESVPIEEKFDDTYMVDLEDGTTIKVENIEQTSAKEPPVIPADGANPESEILVMETESTETTVVEEVIEEDSTFVVQSNQLDYEKEEGMAYTSSIYSMLSIGDAGYMLLANTKAQPENAYIKITDRYDAEKTASIIREYINSGDSYYTEMAAPQGTHFEAVKYNVKYEADAESYVNITLRGLDGNNLKFRGVKYSQMTYDILNKEKVDGEWYINRICFYAVPNGCEEYVLQCGDATDGIGSAYYRIN